MALSREQFSEQVLKHVAVKFPLVKIARGPQPFSMKVNGHVASLENIYRISQMRPDETNHQIDRWVVELLRAGEGTPDQSGALEDLKDRILPMVLPEAVSNSATINQPVVNGLNVAYAIDNDRTIAYIPKSHFETWNITLDDLHQIALNNLLAKSESLEAQVAQDEDGNVSLILFQKLDGYDASRLLLPTLHEKLAGFLGSPFVAGVPNRDILLCFRNEPQTVANMKKQIADDYRSMPHQVTDLLFLVTPDGIAPME
ncbi:MAG TPA: DUF1444 family protein [Tepidisphaeraceae bacterium]|jgi:hypothetical protein|nr:DUF1444 family protein [Tepidisphaeraceae bacterium]